jgi:AbrB family looped-hinge helix DNA binding protein
MEGGYKGITPKLYGTAVLGERGQIVIPAEARRAMNLEPGAKVIVIGGPASEVLMLARADSIAEMMANMIDHMSKLEKMMKLDDDALDSGGD